MPAYLSKYHIELNGNGYIIGHNASGNKYYQKKKAPVFVNKFGSGDSSYRDATFWQYWASTNWRNGAKQLRVDDGGKFWKSSNVDVTQLEQLALSRTLTSIGQTAAGVNVNTLSAWRSSASWWNASYGYRQQLTITAPSQQVPAGYPVKISIDTAALQTAGKVLANRNDWRVVYFNGSSWVDLTRDYIDATTTFFGLQAAIAASGSDSNYYVYYGYAGEATSKQPSAEADWNSVYGMYGTTPDANSVGVFHFKEGTGTAVNDDSSSANNGTLHGAPAWGTDGKLGRYASLVSASSQYMDLADLNFGSFTMEGWIYLPNLTTSYTIASQSANGGGTGNFNWYVDTSGKLNFDANNRTNTNSGTNLLSTSTWYHVAVTNDGSTTKLYINGNLVGSQANAALEAATDSYYIGTRHEASFVGYFNGRVQHFRFSNTARTSFAYVLPSEPTYAAGSETTTQPPSSTFDLYAGCSDGILYKWDSISSFSAQFDTRRLTWFESGGDTDMKIGDVGGTETAQAQSFQIAASAKIKGLEVYLKKNAGTPTAITVRIETNSAGTPSGVLADANLAATITAFTTTSYGWISLDFATASSVALSSGTTYWIVLKIAAGANDNNYAWDAKSTSGYASGNMATSTDGGATWVADAAKDAYFRIKGEATQINDLLISSVGGTQKMLIATGDISSQTNGDARLFSFDGSNYALEKTFNTATESQITKLAEYNSKLYAGLGPQAKVYEGTSPTAWTISKDINTPQNPGYIYAMKEYNGILNVVGGSPEFLPTKYYNGFWYQFDTTTWVDRIPFAYTVPRTLEFYDAFLFGGTYRGDIVVYDTATLNPLFNFKDDYAFAVQVMAQQAFDDRIFFFLSPQDSSGDTNSSVWIFDRHGMSSAVSISGPTSYRCAAVVNNLLMIGTGANGYVYKYDPTVYSTQGYVQTSYFDAGLPSINKLYNSVTVQHDPLEEGESVKIYYRFKESASWVLLGTSNTVDAESSTMTFPSGTYSKKISLKIELNTSNTTITPKVKEYVLQYTLYPARKWLWTLRLYVKKGLTLLDRTKESKSATLLRTNIETAQNSSQLVTFTDIDGTQYNVLFNDIDETSWVVNQNDVNENEIAVTLLEA